MRPLSCCLSLLELVGSASLLLSVHALAQEASGYSAEPSKPGPKLETVVTAHSPEETQDRQFAGSRLWRLDPGQYEVEVWWDEKFKRGEAPEALLKVEIEIGLAPHLQLDLYQNFTIADGAFGVEGNQIELRYAFGRTYNQVPLNPVLYLEWHPRKVQDRAEGRLLLGGDLPAQGLWAANLFFESNVDGFDQPLAEGFDMEAGVSGAVNFSLIGSVLRVGLEAQVGADQHGDPVFYPMALIGPNIVLKWKETGLKLTATGLIGLLPKDPRVRLFAIAGWAF